MMTSFALGSLRGTRRPHRVVAAVALATAGLWMAGSADAVWPDLPSTPLATQVVGDPNMLLTIDDSGSMSWAYAPDSVSNYTGRVYFVSPRINSMAYDPFAVYELPFDATTVNNATPGRLATTFKSALHNGFNSTQGSVNLATSYKPVSVLDPGNGNITYAAGPGVPGGGNAWNTAAPAFIYAFYNDLSSSSTVSAGVVTVPKLPTPGTDPATFSRLTTKPSGCVAPETTNESCYVKVVISGNSAHEQNFANWYSFYKTRVLAVGSSANLALIDLNPKFRVSWQSLWSCKGFNKGSSCTDAVGPVQSNPLRPLSNATQKQTLYNYLSRLPASGNTPLRGAAQRAGAFIQTTGIESPRANQLGISETGPDDAPISACRANFHVMLTDGLWNNGENPGVGNADNTAIGALPDGKSYTPQPPFKDTNSSSLADIAFQQWATDAQTGLANSLLPYYPDSSNTNYWDPKNDPATWQHMNTYAIGIGLSGFLNGSNDANSGYLPIWGGNTYAGDYNALVAGTVQWPKTADNYSGNVADLWHAAINGRGLFFGADSPNAVKEAFRQIFARASAQAANSGQVSGTSRRVTAGSMTFDTKYMPSDWYGTLTAYTVYSDGTRGPSQWNSDTTLTSDSPSRNLFTWDPANGVARTFTWSSFSTAEKQTFFGTTAIPAGDPDLLNYLRGNRSQESTKFRRRIQIFGDVVGSELVASAKTDQGYQFLPASSGGSSYLNFVNKKKSVVFVGANDGMLHGFSTTGAELFGYFPGSILPKLKNLAKAPMVWQHLVDGPLTLGDYYSGSAWKTVLVAGLGGGGKSVVGLDVTGITQTTGSGTFTAGDVLFEIADAEMGYSFSKPTVVRLATGDWVAIWGNGYGGASAKAMLFVYNLTTKTVYKVDTGAGSTTVGQENGLGSPTAVEFSPGNVVAVYAGDYRGNLWKFVLDDTSGKFKVAGSPAAAFFQAKDALNNTQPITAAPEVVLHPAGGTIVLFGTGKFFETADRTTRPISTFYAVRDQGKSGVITRSSLVQQTLTLGATAGAALRAVSTNAVDYGTKAGWYLDFTTTFAGGGASGERIVAKPVLFNDLVAFNTYTPGTNECEGAGTSYLMFLNAFTGGNLAPVYDASGNGSIGNEDRPATGNNYAGIKVDNPGGTMSSPIGSLVANQAAGNPTRTPGQTCGGAGQAPCPGPNPPAGCDSGLIIKAGVCDLPSCKRGNIWTQSASTGACLIAPDSKYPRWMELRWK
ncbi:MAG: hypothetical protein IT523_03375 [Burkholderiales bacterium]|nr:hypothetical protein [Burkholderiales bacterium]